ncbi:TonB-dependent receptor plug domain-containing protein [Sphingomonas sp. HF-S4]|uniref:TonB-dependent receptor plug domain-containing protein n=1 Tax=Sphingomonas agrestis TaxID=3080540 RepID=A0ABU3Y3A0_9SPHN|nr:TonB-dependent receptor [Sphingomonas sp. HF-S4]MDV3455840.1 TonB-dependent receptor plug domain-containing protein [Sphingomonas sp. HF-S4]
MKSKAGAVIVAGLWAGSASAQIATPPEAGQTPEGDSDIVVTAARSTLPASALPLTVDVIDRETLSRQVTVSGSVVDAVSALLPAFSPTREKITGSGETLRGRSPLYAINGIPQTTPIRDGARDGYTIDPFFIDRVEVIYGSNALQGIGATGGVVNQVTVTAPKQDGWSGRTLLQGNAGNDFSFASLGGKLAGLVSFRSGRLDATAGAAFERRSVFIDGRGRRIGYDGNQSEIQDTDSLSFFGRIGLDLSDTARFEVIANRFELEGNNHYVPVDGSRALGIPATTRRGQTPGIPSTGLAEMVSASLTDSDLAGGAFALQGFYNRTSDTFAGGILATFQDAAIAPVGTLFEQSRNVSRKLGGKVSYERAVPGFEALTLTLGFDALIDRTAQTLVHTKRSWVPQTDFRSLAPFGQANLKLLDGIVRLAGGVRYENVQLDIPDYTTIATSRSRFVTGGTPSFERALWNGGIVLEPVKGIRAYGSYAEGYTIADIGRVLRGISQPDVRIDDYLDLTPVTSNNRELGLEVNQGPLIASATYYWSSSDAGQVLVRNDDGIFNVVRQPIDIEGLELNLDTRTPVPGLKLGVGYSHVEGRTDVNGDGFFEADLDGANISPDRLNLNADFSSGRFSARMQGRYYLARRFEGQPAANEFVGYQLFDAYLAYELSIGRLMLSVQNLGNTDYVTYYSDTQGPTDNARFYTGRGRNFTLSWQAAF